MTVDNKNNAKKLYEALHLLRGVKEVSMVPHGVENSDIMDEIELSLNQVKLIQNGKLPLRSLKDTLGDK